MTDITSIAKAIVFTVGLSLRSSLLLKSGMKGGFTDSSIERTPDGRLHINGYVWAGLLRRAIGRLREGQELAQRIGKFGDDRKLSPLWSEATFVEAATLECHLDAIPGIRINRKWGATETGAFYNDEVVNPGVPLVLSLTWLCREDDVPGKITEIIRNALWVVDEGVETIGGGWSYGHGRLSVEHFRAETLDLSQKRDRHRLWRPSEGRRAWSDDERWIKPATARMAAVVKPWVRRSINAKAVDGQLLAIHTTMPPLLPVSSYDKYPDTFVLHRTLFNEEGEPCTSYIVTGKAFRQGVLSAAIERKLRSQGFEICLDTSTDREWDKKMHVEKGLRCRSGRCPRCLWFGDTEAGGIVSVADALVNGAATTVVNRIQLCEHSLQNMNLFSGEYLTRGEFTFDMIVDTSRRDTRPDELLEQIDAVIRELAPGGEAPAGWHRIGATATCTGQFEITEYREVQ